jgi:hypothetical protein
MLQNPIYTKKATSSTHSPFSTFDTSMILPSQFHQAEYVSSTISQTNPSMHLSNAYHSHSNTLRTIYLGNLPSFITYEGVLDHVSAGLIESAKMFEEKNCAFLTFVDSQCAHSFLTEYQTKPLVIQGI